MTKTDHYDRTIWDQCRAWSAATDNEREVADYLGAQWTWTDYRQTVGYPIVIDQKGRAFYFPSRFSSEDLNQSRGDSASLTEWNTKDGHSTSGVKELGTSSLRTVCADPISTLRGGP